MCKGDGGYLNVWNHLFKAKDSFPDIRMLEFARPQKITDCCARKVLLLLHPSLCRVVKLKYPTDVGGIVLDSQVTT